MAGKIVHLTFSKQMIAIIYSSIQKTFAELTLFAKHYAQYDM